MKTGRSGARTNSRGGNDIKRAMAKADREGEAWKTAPRTSQIETVRGNGAMPQKQCLSRI